MQNFTKFLRLDMKASERLRIHDENSMQFRIAGLLAHSGDSWLWCGALFVIWLFVNGEIQREVAWWAGCIGLTALLIFILKKFIPRQRPQGEWGVIYRKGDPHSFPSGHAVRGGLIIILAIYTFHSDWLVWLFVIWALMMIISRVMTGVHYLLDVLAGVVLGFLIGLLCMRLQPWVFGTFGVLFDRSLWF